MIEGGKIGKGPPQSGGGGGENWDLWVGPSTSSRSWDAYWRNNSIKMLLKNPNKNSKGKLIGKSEIFATIQQSCQSYIFSRWFFHGILYHQNELDLFWSLADSINFIVASIGFNLHQRVHGLFSTSRVSFKRRFARRFAVRNLLLTFHADKTIRPFHSMKCKKSRCKIGWMSIIRFDQIVIFISERLKLAHSHISDF